MLHPTPFCLFKNFVHTVITPLPRIAFFFSIRLFLSAHKHVMLLPILKQKLKNSGPDPIHIPSPPVSCFFESFYRSFLFFFFFLNLYVTFLPFFLDTPPLGLSSLPFDLSRSPVTAFWMEGSFSVLISLAFSTSFETLALLLFHSQLLLYWLLKHDSLLLLFLHRLFLLSLFIGLFSCFHMTQSLDLFYIYIFPLWALMLSRVIKL